MGVTRAAAITAGPRRPRSTPAWRISDASANAESPASMSGIGNTFLQACMSGARKWTCARHRTVSMKA